MFPQGCLCWSALWGLINRHGCLLLCFATWCWEAYFAAPTVRVCLWLYSLLSPASWRVHYLLFVGRPIGPHGCVNSGCEVLAKAELFEGICHEISPFTYWTGIMTSVFRCIWPQLFFFFFFCPKSRGSMGVFYKTGSMSRHAHFVNTILAQQKN